MAKNIEFAVNDEYFRSFDKACAYAISISACYGKTVAIDVLCYTKAAALNFGISDYDPDASVTARILVKAEDAGKVP
jgi:hypothetical protein